jgi:hypothetical protein
MIYGILGAVGLSVCVLVIVFMTKSECTEKAKHFDQMMTALVKDNQEIWRRLRESHNVEGAIYDMNKNDISVNKSGCSDPTACQAIKNVDKEMQRVHRLVEALRAVCAVAGFEIEGRIALRDKRTDKVWR